MNEPLWPDLGRRLRDAPEGLVVTLFTPSPAAAWIALGQLGLELVDEPDLYWHHLALHGKSVARAFAPGRVLFVVGFEALDADGRAEVYAHLNRARDQVPGLRTRLVLFVPATDEDLLADNAVDLLAFRGPVRRLAEVEGARATFEPPAWHVVRDVAARRAVACVPHDFPDELLPLVRAIRWGAILFEAGTATRVEEAAHIGLAQERGEIPEYVGGRHLLRRAGGRQRVLLYAPDLQVASAWLTCVRLAARRPEPAGWDPSALSTPGSLPTVDRDASVALVVVDDVPGGTPRASLPFPTLDLRYPDEDDAGAAARIRADALETYRPVPGLLPALAVAAHVIVVGHGLQVEATLTAAAIPWSYQNRPNTVRVHRPWGNPRTGERLRADPYPFPDGRVPGALKLALALPTAWLPFGSTDPRVAALALHERRRAPQLAVGESVPDWLRDAGFAIARTPEDIATWARNLAAHPTPAAIEPPLRDLPDDPELAAVLAHPTVTWQGDALPLADLLTRERRVWLEGEPCCGKSLYAQLLAFGVATRGNPAWSAWAPALPDGVTKVQVRIADHPRRYPDPDELWILDQAHTLRPSEMARLVHWFDALPEDAGRVLVLDRPSVEPIWATRAVWVPPEDPTPWFRWRCDGTPAAAMLAATDLRAVLPAWRTLGMAEVLRTYLRNGVDPTGPRFVLDAATAAFTQAWPLVQPTQLGDVARALAADPNTLPELARRHLPGALTRRPDGTLDWARGTDGVLARVHALTPGDRLVLRHGAANDALDVLTRSLAAIEAADAEVLDTDVFATWIDEACRIPAVAAQYLAQLLRAFDLDRDQLTALLAIRDPAMLAAVAEAHATHGLLGTWGIGPESDPRPDEGPDRNVRFSHVRLDVAPVTVARYAAFVRAGGYFREDLWHPEGWAWRQRNAVTGPADPGDPAHPVTGVSWYEADAYARWSGGALPSEAQWEAAATFGQPGLWSGKREPVMRGGGFPYDMGGNVLEWCLDGYDPGWPAVAPLWDPVCPERPERALRGAPFWVTDPADRHRWRRWHLPPTTRREDVGFRVAYRG